MNRNTLIGIIAIAILIVGGFFWWQSANPSIPAPVSSGSDTGTQTPSNGTPVVGGTETVGTQGSASVDVGIGDASSAITVTYTNQGFSPKSITIHQGDTVKWVNQSSHGMWVASANHPTHTVYSGTSLAQHCPDTSGTAFDECMPGSSFSFTFDKTGTWGYHNHALASDTGTVVVQ